MFKRKPIYIILLIIFTLLLCADIAAYLLMANISNMPSGLPEGFDPSQMQSGDMPAMRQDDSSDGGAGTQDSSSGDMSGTDDSSGDMSGPSGRGDMPEGFDPSQMQGGFDRSGMGMGSAVFTFASLIRNWWIPIAIFCLLVDACCMFMLIRISKKRRQNAEGYIEKEDDNESAVRKSAESGYEKRRKKRRRAISISVIVLAVILAFLLCYVIARGIYLTQLEDEEAAAVISADAADMDIDTAISGTGTLEKADVEEITVPNEVEIESYSVENGDTVAEGDVLAMAGHTSVMKAIEDLQDALEVLDEQIDDASSDEIESVIEASVDGRIKAIYAEKGTGVADTMYDNGALILISLDGLMAADIETQADIATGESVVVVLADGTEKAGRVSNSINGMVTVTVTDNGTGFGEEVTVKDEGGAMLGTGTLYIHSKLKITGFSGTVSKIKCSENEKVSTGDTLLTLTDTEYTAEYDSLLKKRSEYEDEMMKLFKLYQDGNIYAEFAGIVSGIDEESEAYTGASETGYSSESSTASTLAYLSPLPTSTTVVETLLYAKDDASESVLLGNNPAGTDDATVAGYANYAATVSSVSYSAISLMEYPASLSITDYGNYTALGITSAMMTTATQISPSLTTPVYMFANGAWVSVSVSDIAAGDTLIVTYDSAGNLVWIVIVSKGQTKQGGGTNTGGGSYSGGTASASTQTEEPAEPEDYYTISETTVMTATPTDVMNVEIAIDELDILLLKAGQEATITLDAVSGETFTGFVTNIDLEGTNSGGSTKYTTEVSIEKTEQMLAGMNAAVSITLSTKECGVTIPVAALSENEAGAFVYTGYDAENEALINPVSVETGLSDGMNVEILSGLDAGDTVWFEYDDTVDMSSSVVSSSNGGGFNLMSIFGGDRNRRG